MRPYDCVKCEEKNCGCDTCVHNEYEEFCDLCGYENCYWEGR